MLAMALACLCFGHDSLADPLHRIADDAFWHHDSGWIFPEKIGGFVRIGVPQDIAGSRDAVAYYACDTDGLRTIASVDIYPADSPTGPMTFAAAKAALERESAGARLQTEGAFTIDERRLTAIRARYVTDRGEARSDYSGLYFVDSGEWLVEIRITAPAIGSDTLQTLDAFVRGQRWETLGHPEGLPSSN
jgi:hypothetical protein